MATSTPQADHIVAPDAPRWRTVDPTFGVCDFALSWLITRGHTGTLDLTDRQVVVVGPYDDDEEGSPWTVSLFVDDRADHPAASDESVACGIPGLDHPAGSHLTHAARRVRTAARLGVVRPLRIRDRLRLPVRLTAAWLAEAVHGPAESGHERRLGTVGPDDGARARAATASTNAAGSGELGDRHRKAVQELIRTALCDLLGIDHPIIQAGMGPFAPASLAAAVSNAGGLGSIGTFGLDPIRLVRPAEDLDRQFASIKGLTDRAFAINYVVPYFEERTDERAALFDRGLSIGPKVVSFALGEPGADLVQRVHDAGALVMLQVTTVAQAEQAAARGIDVIVAQGGEAGGYGGSVATMVLVPQVVDAVQPIPVVAAGSIYDGRGLAAALVLGAVGVNIGTRFLASREATISDGYKQTILAAASEDAVKFDSLNDLLASPGTRGYRTVLRSVKTPFIDELQAKPELARRDSQRLLGVLSTAIQAGNVHEVMPTAGQTAGGIHDVAPAADIVRRMVAEAEIALAGAPKPS